MNKTKMILAGTGGAIGLIVLVLGFLVWQAFSAKTAAIEGDDEEGVDGLETVESRAQTLSRKPVYPCAASVTALEENQKSLGEWCKEGLSLAARGDRTFPKTTPAQFKTDIVADAKRLMALPGGVAGKLVKPDFAFGPFKDYIVEGKMPSEQELAELQRKWDDVATVTELLATNGVAELVDVQFKAKAEASGAQDKRDARGKGDKRKGAAKSGDQTTEQSDNFFSYVFTFAAKPSAFVDVVNALETEERFIVVENFAFSRGTDVLAEALGGGDDKKKDAAQASTGRRGRRGRRGAEAAAAPVAEGRDGTEKTKNGIVTDPLIDAPMTVTMTVTVHDFRSLEESGEAVNAADSGASGKNSASTLRKGASK